jgi:ElaB/YqjD/DUF883 family membrane-anchored ribosome-binding protein
MTDLSPFAADGKRDALRARIEAAERRNAERTLAVQAREAASAAADYTRAHPLTVIGGALAVGLAIGLLTRPGRQLAQRVATGAGEAVSGVRNSATSGVKRVAVKSGTQLGTLIGEAVMSYVMTIIDDALDTARTGQERAADLGDAAGDKVREARAAAVRVAKDLKRKAKR